MGKYNKMTSYQIKLNIRLNFEKKYSGARNYV